MQLKKAACVSAVTKALLCRACSTHPIYIYGVNPSVSSSYKKQNRIINALDVLLGPTLATRKISSSEQSGCLNNELLELRFLSGWHTELCQSWRLLWEGPTYCKKNIINTKACRLRGTNGCHNGVAIAVLDVSCLSGLQSQKESKPQARLTDPYISVQREEPRS